MKNLIKYLSVLLFAVGSSAAMALPISGNIGFFGTSNVVGTDLDIFAAYVSLADGDYVTEGVTATTPSGLGDSVAFNAFDYAEDPFTGVTPLWSVGGFSFNLDTLTVGPTGGGVDLALSGRGTLKHANYDDTVVFWEYSGNYFGGSTFQTFSSSVPEPGSLALLGLGLIGFGIAGYGRRRQA